MNESAEPTMKWVGRRAPARVNLEAAEGFLKLAVELRRGRPFIPKGVHRFKSFEEADAWTLKMITRPGNRGCQP
jgi:hypothetical protein